MNNSKKAKKILDRYKKLVWPEVKKYLNEPQYPRAFEIPPKYAKFRDFHWKLIRDYPERQGKYLRPTLVMLAAEAMGVTASKTIKTACGMQLSEDWLLNHDDWEDDSLQRRGKPALHRLYGPELAVNAGDALHIIMWKVFFDNAQVLGYKKAWEILNEFYVMLIRTTTGQATEIKITKDNLSQFTDNDWYFIADGKTSYYTIATPLRLGAILAGASRKQLDKLAEFGIYLGRCFQLVDDILDVTSNFEGLKEYANDIYEGKRTIILGHLLRNANPADKKKLLAILKKSREKKTKAEVSWIIDKMHRKGSILYAQKLAVKFRNKAKTMFTKNLQFLKKEPARQHLLTLIDFILERKH